MLDGRLTCRVYGPAFLFESEGRGVRPLLELLDSEKDLRGCSIIDKVTGKAASFLYVLLGFKEVKTGIISKPALDNLEKHGIKVTYDKVVPMILNHAKNDYCPLEKAVASISNPDEALSSIRLAIKKMMAASV